MAHNNVFVKTITHLKDRPNADHALELLKKTASLVKPIMRKYGWILPELSEFYPDNPNLLDVNAGQKILIRLRPYNSPTWFYDLEDIVGTMLHELTHNVHGPHDDKFYTLLNKLQEEYYALKRSGYAGEGFYSPGHRLGGSSSSSSRDVPPHVARQKALEAAQKRKQVSQVLGSGSRTLGGLGGGPSTRNLSPRELAARAAERRIRDAKSCGSQQGRELAERESAKAAQEGIRNEVIDLTLDDDDDLWEPDWISDPEDGDDEVIIVEEVHRAPTVNGSKMKDSGRPPAPQGKGRQRAISPKPKASSSRNASSWACDQCTLINEGTAKECDACGFRPKPVEELVGWTCFVCGEIGMDHQFWSCRSCGSIKAES
ncbi:hypothetical protein CC1G_13736 [Coprinopsis cinerea okayama7|uniref:WLM-domain-containing protein n=1 Tax=Coprinopsis cinerea (strain Okayama-7 / 130 / ATCC MYA-4618 / FGSC 9003) TaxID=240176 RepID=D6RJQ9_COPC7|nr:hypothetical protein CC1G_13736 [Coprinopsis cinerea okayama7\|eukprot:XP_002912204.1 hypothetical protein CC1G_13736 [Coprinopsis cinerea okayama7\